MTDSEREGKDKIGIGLRPTTPDEIVAHVENHFDSQVRVQFAPKGELITIPDGWHGAGKVGEVLVHVGHLLTAPIAGTALPAQRLLDWALDQRFSITDSQGHTVSVKQAVATLEGDSYSWGDNQALIRLTRSVRDTTPIEIQFYAGATNPWIRTLSEIGNKGVGAIAPDERDEYRRSVQQLLRPFISRGTKEERNRLGLAANVDVLRRVDDCAASLVTFIGDQIVDDAMNTSREHLLEVHDISVATLQAVVLAISMAQRRHVPLVMRIGAPAFGLGTDRGLNYIMNTLPELQQYGPLTVGDMGKLMDEGDSADATPNLVTVRQGDASRELRLFLGGGLPVSKMLASVHSERRKPMGWDIATRRASRVDDGPDHWGVLISGTNVTVRTARRDKSFIRPGAELVRHDNEPWIVGEAGLWASLGEEEGGLIPVAFMDRGNLVTLYLPAQVHSDN